jgi:transposase/FtsZ-binding cell division protein ZapB
MKSRTLPQWTELDIWKGRAACLEAENKQLRAENIQLWAENAALRAEYETLPAENAQLRAENTALAARVNELEGQMEELKARVLKLTQQVYGHKSEQRSTKEKDSANDRPQIQSEGRRGQRQGSKGHGRRRRLNLPMREEIHDLPEAKQRCPRCGLPYAPFPIDETSEEIDWQVKVERVVHKRKRYQKTCQCRGVPAIITAPPPTKVIAKGLFTAGFIARLLVEKFVLGRPLYRIGIALQMENLALSQGTLVGVLQQVALLLAPLDEAIRAHCRSASLWQADETGWKVFEEVEGKASNRWWLWVFASSDAVVFIMDPSRSASAPKKFFGLMGSDPPPVTGLLGSDFYRVYQALGEGIQSFFCWAHLRRCFLETARGYPQLEGWTDQWQDRIATLYRLHKTRQGLPPATSGYREANDVLRRFVTAEIETNWRSQVTDQTLHRAARDVLGTVERHWGGLTRFLDNPELPLDNNAMERLLRTPVVGRKNFYGSGSQWSGELAARVWTVAATAARANLNPLSYLTDLLTACATNGSRPLAGYAINRFLPWMMSDADRKAWARGPSP